MNAVVGGLVQNVETLARFRTQAGAVGADLVLTPELSLTGYPPEDLLLKEGFIASAGVALDDLSRLLDLPPILVGTVVSEAPDIPLAPSGDGRDVTNMLFDEPSLPHIANALVAVTDEGVVATATKRLLPNYDVFDEVRYLRRCLGPHTMLILPGGAVCLMICEVVWTWHGPGAEVGPHV